MKTRMKILNFHSFWSNKNLLKANKVDLDRFINTMHSLTADKTETRPMIFSRKSYYVIQIDTNAT